MKESNVWGIRPAEEVSKEINREESGVPEREIPSVLLRADGTRVTTAWEWIFRRRPEILDFYRKNVFGDPLPRPDQVVREVLSVKEGALGGAAVRREIRLTFRMANGLSRSFIMLLYLPAKASPSAPVPVFVELNFRGNHASAGEKDCMETGFDVNGELVEKERSVQSGRLPAELIVGRGFAVATACYHDIFPDFFTDFALSDGSLERKAWARSVYGMFFPGASMEALNRRYSAIGAWAWGLSRMLDALEGIPGVNCRQAAAVGHSRLGKTALWAGACDRRFQLVASNDSGHGGAALFKRCLGESVESLISHFPHWFVEDFRRYARKDADLEFDQHFLLSLIAPRTLCIASATEDWWADPRGEFLAGLHASEAYRLFGVRGMASEEMPPPDRYLDGEVNYHLRTGPHGIDARDWTHYLNAADRTFRG